MKEKRYPYQNLSLKDIEGEEWEDIPGLDGYYCVSNFGRVKRTEYEMQYHNGAIYVKPEKIIKPDIRKALNKFIGDYVSFLTARVTLFGKRYNYTIARLVYHCFVTPFNMEDSRILVLTKDCDNFNIVPSNLFAATHEQKQKRIFQRSRAQSPLLDLPDALRQKIRKKIVQTKSKQITQYTKLGKKIKTFSSMAAAQRATGISAVCIRRAANGELITAGSFMWNLGNEKRTITDLKSLKAERRKELRKNYKTMAVTQYNMQGNRIAFYPSLTDAEEATGINGAQISLAAKGVYKSAKGYFWKKGFGKEKIDLKGHKYGKTSMAATQSKKVKQYAMDGKYLQTFSSIKQAAEQTRVHSTTIVDALKGRQKTAGGFKWKYAEKGE